MIYLPLGEPSTSKHCFSKEQSRLEEGGSLTLEANCWNWIFPKGDSSFQLHEQAISSRPEWQSNFWTVDGCLCASTPVCAHTHTHTKQHKPESTNPLWSTPGCCSLTLLASYFAAHLGKARRSSSVQLESWSCVPRDRKALGTHDLSSQRHCSSAQPPRPSSLST